MYEVTLIGFGEDARKHLPYVGHVGIEFRRDVGAILTGSVGESCRVISEYFCAAGLQQNRGKTVKLGE